MSAPPGLIDGGHFGPGSTLRKVISETIVGLSAPRVLLLQAAHPVAFAGFFAHSGALDAPYERLERTTLIMNTVAFGTQEMADAATARVRAMHRRVQGETTSAAGPWPKGTPYSATDPDLLLWILATLADGGSTVYRRWVGPLSGEELDALWQDYRVVGNLFGLADEDMPEDWAGFQAYWDEMLASGELHLSDEARALALDIVMDPPVPFWARPAFELVKQITIGELPPSIREQYGFGWDPARGAALELSRTSVKRVVRPLLPDVARRIGVARNGLPEEQQQQAAKLRARQPVGAT